MNAIEISENLHKYDLNEIRSQILKVIEIDKEKPIVHSFTKCNVFIYILKDLQYTSSWILDLVSGMGSAVFRSSLAAQR